MILDQLFLKTLDLLENLDYIGLFILTGFAQIFGFPTEISIPIAGMFFGLDALAITFAFLGDFAAAIIIIYAGKFTKIFLKREIKPFSLKEIFVLRFVPIVRGAILPALRDYETKDIVLILGISSFLWSLVLVFLGSKLDPIEVYKFLRRFEPVLLTLTAIFISYKYRSKIRKYLYKFVGTVRTWLRRTKTGEK